MSTTTQDQKLDDLFAILRADAPDVRSDEIVMLLQRSAPIPDPFVPSTTHRKGLIPMIAFLSIALVSTVILLTNTPTSETTVPQARVNLPVQTPQPQQSPPTTKAERHVPSKNLIKSLPFSKTPVAPARWVTITDDRLAGLGIDRMPNGDIALDDGSKTRLLFPTDTFAHAIVAESKLNVPFTLFPKIITDTKGNLVMIGEHSVSKGGGRSTRVTFVAGMPAALSSLTYYRITSIHKSGATIDSSVTPPDFVTPLKATVGIMTLDTIIRFPYGDLAAESSIQKGIIERLAAKDSVYKSQFGGEDGLRAKFGNALSSNASATERSILHVYDSLGSLDISELERTKKQFQYLASILRSSEYAPIMKLKVEQFSRAVDHKLYLLQHQEDEKKLAQIDAYVPILVRTSTASLPDPEYDNGLIFWYEPSEELAAALPKLRNEQLMQRQHELRQDFTIYPNPTNMYVFIRSQQASGLSMKAELKNLLGSDVLPPQLLRIAGGKVDERIDVSTVLPGIYFLTLSTEQGLRSTWRVVVQ